MTTTSTNIYTTINTLAENFKSVFKQGDAAGVADFYSDKGMLLPAGSDFIQGKNDIETYWQDAINMGIKNVSLDIIEIEQHDDTVIEMSNYSLSNDNDQVVDYGKGIVIWKFEAGSWKMHRDIWNTSIE